MSTKTIFRKYPEGDIIALFPEIKESNYCCLSYMHLGQHGAADYSHVISTTKKALPSEYAELYQRTRL